MHYIDESEVQNRIKTDVAVQDGIFTALSLNGDIRFLPEDEYINGIIADFTLIQENSIRAIIECKAGNINVTDYVRGIGQLYQYEYFGEQKTPHRSFEYADGFETVYLYPSTVIKNNSFNIGRFKYPQSTTILELNHQNNAIRKITKEELSRLEQSEDDNLVTVSQYYFRDNRIFEYYILLRYLMHLDSLGYDKCDRKQAEDSFLKRTNTINNGNWRNAFITLANLGLIDNNNLPTMAGKNLAIRQYENFAVEMYHSYLEPYFDLFIECFGEKNKIVLSNQDFVSKIRSKYSDRDVLYVTQSNGRYISSWLNIFRDDYGIISFEARHNDRTLEFNPIELNDDALARKIRSNSIAYQYIDRFINLLREG